MNVSIRLKTIGDLIDKNDVVADVGADHGFLELYLIAKHETISILAIENKIGPFQILDERLRAIKTIRLSLSDGLTAVDNTINCLVIAGMGGLNIRNILLARKDKLIGIKKIIIDAHRDADVARKTIVSLGFRIEKEIIVYEQEKFYLISEFIRNENVQKYNQDELDFGYQIFEDKLWPKYKEYLLKINKDKLQKISNLRNTQDKVLELKKFNERLVNYGKD